MLKIETGKECDGRWIAEVPSLPGVMAYGETKANARLNVIVLVLRVIADRLEHREPLTVQ
jgi:predicted RNase H-like HicB family nuclease